MPRKRTVQRKIKGYSVTVETINKKTRATATLDIFIGGDLPKQNYKLLEYIKKHFEGGEIIIYNISKIVPEVRLYKMLEIDYLNNGKTTYTILSKGEKKNE